MQGSIGPLRGRFVRSARSFGLVFAAFWLCSSAGCGGSGGSTAPSSSESTAKPASNSPTADSPAPAPGTKEPASGAAAPNSDAARLLEQMLAAYRSAKSYRDEATITLSYRQEGRPFRDEASIACQFERPNRIRLRAYQVELASDGVEMRGRIADAATAQLDGQFLVRPAPETLNLAALIDDPLLEDQLGNGLVLPEAGRLPLQVAFLLSEQPVELVAGRDLQLELLPVQKIDGRECAGVAAKTVRGRFLFWIDRDLHLLRRLEYPREALTPRLAEAREIADVRLVADFHQARFDEPPAQDAFQFDPPPDAKIVRFFVPPPQPLPTDRFGQEVTGVELTTPDGDSVSRATLDGRIAAFLWFSGDAECEPSVRQFAAVRKRFADQPRLTFYAVATHPSTVSHRQLREQLQAWKAELPLVRDLQAHGRDRLDINATPTLVVLDEAGRLQLYETGVNPQLAEQLPVVLDKLLEGEDVAAAVLSQYAQERRQYERRLELARNAEGITTIDLPNVPLAEASQPKRLKLQTVWESKAAERPGNLLITSGAEPQAPPRLRLLEGGRRLVELDPADGKLVNRIELQLPDDVVVQRIRAGSTKSGDERFAAWSPQGKKIYLLDGAGKLLAAYPDEDARHDGVRDALIADLDADGTLECYVGFLGAAGLHAVGFDGKRLWSNRKAGSIVSLAASSPNPVGWRKLIAVGAQGQVVQSNQFGNADPARTVAGWTLGQLVADPSAVERPAPLCGLGLDREGRYCAVALDAALTEQWNYPLPEGVWRSAVEPIAPTALLGTGRPAWLLAGVDGGVHVVSDDGEFSDYFYLGRLPSGIGSLKLDDERSLLIVADETGVTAWKTTVGE